MKTPAPKPRDNKACCLNKSDAASIQPALSAADALKSAWQAVAKRDVAATLHWFRQALNIQPDNAQALCWQHYEKFYTPILPTPAPYIEAFGYQ